MFACLVEVGLQRRQRSTSPKGPRERTDAEQEKATGRSGVWQLWNQFL